jgi:hypothetical protein
MKGRRNQLNEIAEKAACCNTAIKLIKSEVTSVDLCFYVVKPTDKVKVLLLADANLMAG